MAGQKKQNLIYQMEAKVKESGLREGGRIGKIIPQRSNPSDLFFVAKNYRVPGEVLKYKHKNTFLFSMHIWLFGYKITYICKLLSIGGSTRQL